MLLACCVPKARASPMDMIMLLIFVLSFSYIMSFFCSVIVNNSPNDSAVVPVAVLATVGITAVLTIYAFVCKGNYLIWIGIILVCAMAALVVGVSIIFTSIKALVYVYCALAVIIFGVYLVIITKSIIGGDFAEFPMDHPILASLFLYMYIMRIFLYILMILGLGGGRRWSKNTSHLFQSTYQIALIVYKSIDNQSSIIMIVSWSSHFSNFQKESFNSENSNCQSEFFHGSDS